MCYDLHLLNSSLIRIGSKELLGASGGGREKGKVDGLNLPGKNRLAIINPWQAWQVAPVSQL